MLPATRKKKTSVFFFFTKPQLTPIFPIIITLFQKVVITLPSYSHCHIGK